jgi:threonine/homoserine/homoserine lactone efflux protein
MAFLDGLWIGIATIILIGPVVFTLLKASLSHGRIGGYLVALGIIISDILIALICMKGANALLRFEVNEDYVAIAAGIILMTLGLKYVLKPRLYDSNLSALNNKSQLGLLFSGFLVNFVNPFVFFVWITLSAHATNTYPEIGDQWGFLIGVLSGIFVGDLLKATLAARLRPYLAPIVLRRVFIIIGFLLIGFGFRAFIHAWVN